MRQLFSRIISITLHNKGFKAASLIVAIVTWYAIQPVISFETIVGDVPVKVVTDPGWAILDQSPSTADVHLRGTRETIRRADHNELEITVDIRGRTHKETVLAGLYPRNVRVPTGSRVMYVRPSEIRIQLDREIEKTVPVQPDLEGTLPDGYEVDRIAIEPSSVSITGPRQRLQDIRSVRTMPISMEGRMESFKQRIGIAHPSPAWMVRIQPDRVEVDVIVSERVSPE